MEFQVGHSHWNSRERLRLEIRTCESISLEETLKAMVLKPSYEITERGYRRRRKEGIGSLGFQSGVEDVRGGGPGPRRHLRRSREEVWTGPCLEACLRQLWTQEGFRQPVC